jgi:hypothetical protein
VTDVMAVGDYPDSPLPGPKHWVLTFPHTPDNVYVEVRHEPDTATGGQGMDVFTPRRGSRGPRVTVTLGEETRGDLLTLQAWLDKNLPKTQEQITKGKRSWWTESEALRYAVRHCVTQFG